jgi:signal peptidase complex subunit 3
MRVYTFHVDIAGQKDQSSEFVTYSLRNMVHSISARVNFLFSITLTTMATCAGLMAGTSILLDFINPCRPTGHIRAQHSGQAFTSWDGHPLAPQHRRHRHYVGIELGIDADFTSCFNWNTKQLFVYAVAEYETAEYQRNEITLWDSIITTTNDAKFSLPKAIEYRFQDVATSLAVGTNVTIKLHYHIMSQSGWTFMRTVDQADTSFVLGAPR